MLFSCNFHNSRNYKINLFFDKRRLEFQEVLLVVHILFNTNSFVNTGPDEYVKFWSWARVNI